MGKQQVEVAGPQPLEGLTFVITGTLPTLSREQAKQMIEQHKSQLEGITQALLKYETLTGEEIDRLMKDGKIDRPDQPSGPSAVQPVSGSAVPKAGKKFGGEGGAAPQGA